MPIFFQGNRYHPHTTPGRVSIIMQSIHLKYLWLTIRSPRPHHTVHVLIGSRIWPSDYDVWRLISTFSRNNRHFRSARLTFLCTLWAFGGGFLKWYGINVPENHLSCRQIRADCGHTIIKLQILEKMCNFPPSFPNFNIWRHFGSFGNTRSYSFWSVKTATVRTTVWVP